MAYTELQMHTCIPSEGLPTHDTVDLGDLKGQLINYLMGKPGPAPAAIWVRS